MRRWIWLGIILVFLLASLAPMFYELSRQNDLHADRQFELVHNFYTDYNFYLSRIREGREGAWTVTEKYTSEPHAGSYLQIMYLYMGKVGALVGAPIERIDAIYHVGRIVLAGTLLFLIAWTMKWAFEKKPFGWQILAFLLSVTAASWPIFVFHKGEWRTGSYMPWWSIMDSLQRITFLPHMLVGQALLLFLLLAMVSRSVMEKARNWIFLGFLAIMLGIIFPPGLVFTFAVLGVFVITDYVVFRPSARDRASWLITRVAGPAAVGIMGAPTLLYLSLVLKIYPWKRLIDYAMLHHQPFVLNEYLLAVGPILVLGALGGLWAVIQRERRLWLFVAWAITWFAFIVAFQYIRQESPLRFTEMIPQVPLGILATYFFYQLYVLVSARIVKTGRSVLSIITLALPILLIILGLVQMYSSWRWQKEFLDQKITATRPLVPTGSYVMYPLKDFIAAMMYLANSTPREAVVLSETTAGNYLPVYSGNTVYVGHANTVNTEQKEQVVHRFFAGGMTREEAQSFLVRNNLHYIYFGPQEQDDGRLADLTRAYPFLTMVYSNPRVRIYTW